MHAATWPRAVDQARGPLELQAPSTVADDHRRHRQVQPVQALLRKKARYRHAAALDKQPRATPGVQRRDGVRQVQGGVVYGMSTLLSESSVANGRIVETNFHTLHMPKIVHMPKVETVIAPTYDFWGGVGEPTICVVIPSILNAVYAATGKPVRSLPLADGLRLV